VLYGQGNGALFIIGKCPIQVPPVTRFYLSNKLMAVLVSGRSSTNAFGISARRPEGVAGLTECGSVLSHRFVGLIEFSGMVAFTYFSCRRSVLSVDSAVWRFLRVKVGATEFGRGHPRTSAVGHSSLCFLKNEKRGGHITHSCGYTTGFEMRKNPNGKAAEWSVMYRKGIVGA
jgi:hypothetical protein